MLLLREKQWHLRTHCRPWRDKININFIEKNNSSVGLTMKGILKKVVDTNNAILWSRIRHQILGCSQILVLDFCGWPEFGPRSSGVARIWHQTFRGYSFQYGWLPGMGGAFSSRAELAGARMKICGAGWDGAGRKSA